MQLSNRNVIIVAGPTAVGKTALGIYLAKVFNGEVISADSMQLYKEMNIGSATPTVEEQDGVPHHLMSIMDPQESFSVADYALMAKEKIEDILSRGKTPVIVGGTGLYINSLVYQMDFGNKEEDSAFRKELDAYAEKNGIEALYKRLVDLNPGMAEKVHPNNIKRVIRAIEVATHLSEDPTKGERDFSTTPQRTKDYNFIFIGLDMLRLKLYARINRRVDLMMEEGLLNEVISLRDKGLTSEHRSMQGIGYKELLFALDGKMSQEDAISLIKQSSRHYAKRQLTWFRRYDFIEWYHVDQYEDAKSLFQTVEKDIREKLNRLYTGGVS